MAYREEGGLIDGLRIITFSVVATNNAVDHAQAPASLNDRKYPATVALPSYNYIAIIRDTFPRACAFRKMLHETNVSGSRGMFSTPPLFVSNID